MSARHEYTARGGTVFRTGITDTADPNLIYIKENTGYHFQVGIPFSDLLEYVRHVEGQEGSDARLADQADAWVTVYRLCRSLGMRSEKYPSGIEAVQDFIIGAAARQAPPLSRRTEVLDEPEETLLDVRLKNAQRDTRQLVEQLRSTFNIAVSESPVEAMVISPLIEEANHVWQRLTELISTRGK